MAIHGCATRRSHNNTDGEITAKTPTWLTNSRRQERRQTEPEICRALQAGVAREGRDEGLKASLLGRARARPAEAV